MNDELPWQKFLFHLLNLRLQRHCEFRLAPVPARRNELHIATEEAAAGRFPFPVALSLSTATDLRAELAYFMARMFPDYLTVACHHRFPPLLRCVNNARIAARSAFCRA